MTKTLEMIFRNEIGKEVTLSLADPKDNLTSAEVQTVMEAIVDRNIFNTKNGDLVQVVEGRIRTRDTVALA